MVERHLASMLAGVERKLIASLEESRASFQHAGLRGDAVEASLREMLDSRLPRYLTVGTGEVIDSKDARSGQTDVVIANVDQPFRAGRDEAGVFLIEGVAAAGEVKSRLTTHELDDSIAKGSRFKRLRNGHLNNDMISTNQVDRQRFYECPPYFLVAFESVVNTDTLMTQLNNASLVLPENGQGDGLPALDAVFVLGKGCAINYAAGGCLVFQYTNGPLAGQTAIGWSWMDREAVLVDFFLWLSATMPRVQRFGSIAIPYLLSHLAQS